jgi:hypothetical protein
MSLSYLLICAAMATQTDVGGYFRIMTRPDLQGGSGRLGYWNLYGRLLNEGPYATLDFRYQMADKSLDGRPWTSVHARVEGGSIGNADIYNGSLSQLRLSQTYVLAGNTGIPGVIWQLGTLDTYFGDLALYDFRPAQIFNDTVGLSARYQTDNFEILVGGGDSGYAIRQENYNTVFTGGGTIRYRPIKRLELGLGGQYRYEPTIEGNRASPYRTPDINFEDYIRKEVIQNYTEENPYRLLDFPDPEPVSASSMKAIGYLGFGGFGPVIWNNLYFTYERRHPEGPVLETYKDSEYTLHITDLTDERTILFLGNEIQLRIIPNRFDIAWAAVYGNHLDGDNDILPSDHDRSYSSTVLRSQVYIRPTLHLLLESSLAKESSRNGNNFREHSDSIFQNSDGFPDSRGLEMGDTDTRITWQGKGGFVLNPLGIGLFSRPSLRILYGAQHSNQNNAFGNQFVENLDQYNEFGNVEQHWHHVIAMETEVWF